MPWQNAQSSRSRSLPSTVSCTSTSIAQRRRYAPGAMSAVIKICPMPAIEFGAVAVTVGDRAWGDTDRESPRIAESGCVEWDSAAGVLVHLRLPWLGMPRAVRCDRLWSKSGAAASGLHRDGQPAGGLSERERHEGAVRVVAIAAERGTGDEACLGVEGSRRREEVHASGLQRDSPYRTGAGVGE